MDPLHETALINPQTNALAFKVLQFADDKYFENLSNYNYYTVILVRNGEGQLILDEKTYEFSENCLIRVPIYQPYQLKSRGPLHGVLLQFHPDFFWNHKYQTELPCKQALFKNIDDIPLQLLSQKVNTLRTVGGGAAHIAGIAEVLKEVPCQDRHRF